MCGRANGLPRFAAGLYSGAELNGKDLTEKADRLSYLEKLLTHTQSLLGESFAVGIFSCFGIGVVLCTGLLVRCPVCTPA